jgi:hypothetical protein
VLLDQATVIDGRPRIGAWVEVEAVPGPGGALVARRLRVVGG